MNLAPFTPFFRTMHRAAALSALAAFSLPVAAQSAGDSVLNVGWFHLYTDDSSKPLTFSQPGIGPVAGSGSTVGDADTLGVAYTYFVTNNFALTLDAGIPPKFNLKGEGTLEPLGHLGSAKQWSPAILAKWYFGQPEDKWRPFIGLGATHVWYTSVNLSQSLQNSVSAFGGPGGSASASLSSSWAPVANIGVSYNLDQKWSIGFSLSYIPLETEADITGRNAAGAVVSRSRTKLTLDPYVTFLSVGYKF